MTAAHTGTRTLEPAVTRPSALEGIVVGVATIAIIVVLALVPLLTPPFIHAALDAAGSARILALDGAAIRAISDRAVADLLSPTGTFVIDGPGGEPFFDRSEQVHLGDARTLLWLTLAAGVTGTVIVAGALVRHGGEGRRFVWRAIARAGATAAIGAVALGVIGAVAFGALFTLFHQIAFPSGNWSFDPATQRLVQLYPIAFWQVAAGALGVLVVIIGALTWWLARQAASAATRATGTRATGTA